MPGSSIVELAVAADEPPPAPCGGIVAAAVDEEAPDGSSPGGARAVVGGEEFVVGGWADYEIDRRRAQWQYGGGAGERPGDRYPGRRFIYADDAVESLAAAPRASSRNVLRVAARRLADVLGTVEDALCDPDEDGVWECAALRSNGASDTLTIPPVTSADLRQFASEPNPIAEDMYDLARDVAALVGATGTILPALPSLAPDSDLPALPSQAVPVGDDEAVLQLESAVGPHLRSLEDLRAALATRLDIAAEALAAALAGGCARALEA